MSELEQDTHLEDMENIVGENAAEAVNEEMGGEVIEGEMGGASSMSQLIMMAIQTSMR